MISKGLLLNVGVDKLPYQSLEHLKERMLKLFRGRDWISWGAGIESHPRNDGMQLSVNQEYVKLPYSFQHGEIWLILFNVILNFVFLLMYEFVYCPVPCFDVLDTNDGWTVHLSTTG